MTPKDSDILDNVYFGVPIGDGGYEYKPIGEIQHVDLTDSSSMFPRFGEDMYSCFCKVKPGTTRIGWVALTEAIWNGNFLYYDFPKKGRRKLSRYRHRRNKC